VNRYRSAWRRHRAVLGVIAAGGVLGAEGRYVLDLLLEGAGPWPWATFVANATGCFLIGILMVVILELTEPHRLVRPFLGIGVLGGFTTFSAYALETHELMNDGRLPLALAYFAATPILALAFAWAGTTVTRTVITRRRGGRP
jgi:fluoride exporter